MAQPITFNRLTNILWILTFLGFVFVVATLGVTVSAAQGFLQNLHYPSIPGKLACNIAAAVLTLLVFIIIVPLKLFELTRWIDLNSHWSSWPRAAILGILSAFWIGAVATSVYNCGDLCSPKRSTDSIVKYASICCSCDDYSRFDSSEISNDSGSFSDIELVEHRYQATQALDAVLMILFFDPTASLILMHWIKRNGSSASPNNHPGEAQASEQPPPYNKDTAGSDRR